MTEIEALRAIIESAKKKEAENKKWCELAVANRAGKKVQEEIRIEYDKAQVQRRALEKATVAFESQAGRRLCCMNGHGPASVVSFDL